MTVWALLAGYAKIDLGRSKASAVFIFLKHNKKILLSLKNIYFSIYLTWVKKIESIWEYLQNKSLKLVVNVDRNFALLATYSHSYKISIQYCNIIFFWKVLPFSEELPKMWARCRCHKFTLELIIFEANHECPMLFL